MKKILLTAACLFIASPASAMTITDISMAFYDASRPRLHTGYSTTVTGAIDTTAATGQLVGDVPFFGADWQADVVWAAESDGTKTWSGVGGPVWDGTGYSNIPFNYNFTLAAGNVAVGLFWDWASNDNIPVLAVLHPNGDGTYSAVDQVWYNGTSTTPQRGMQTAPFNNTLIAFSVASDELLIPPLPAPPPVPGPPPVPEPASLLLIGSGLTGLAGLGSRRRRGR